MFALEGKRATIPAFFQRLLTWLTSLSQSPVRTFRETVTIAYLTILHSLSDRHVASVDTISQLETQRTTIESRSKVNEKQVRQLDEQIAAVETTINTLYAIIKAYFTAIFTHRWRDVDSHVRVMCIEALGQWIMTNKPLFLLADDRDTYLKYIAWTLNDRDVKVRKMSLSVLTELYRQSDTTMMNNLSALTTRYFPRINQMCDDIDTTVSALAVDCMTVLLKAGRLSEMDGNHILQLLWADTADIRYAAADFVYEDTFADSHANDHVKPASTADNQTDIGQLLHIFDAHCPSAPAFRQLSVVDHSLLTISDSDLSRPFALLVDSFWSRLPCLNDWNAFTTLILWTVADKSDSRRKSVKATPAADGQLPIIPLLYLFAAAVRRASGHDMAATKLSKSDKTDLLQTSEVCTTHLIQHLPELLQAFTSDAHAARILLSLVSIINVDMYSGLKKLDEFQSLLNATKTIVMTHSDQDLLNECGIALAVLCGDHSFSEYSQTTVTELTTQLSSQWKNEAKAVNERLGLRTNDDDKAAALAAVLKRIVSLYQAIYSVDLSWVSSPLYSRVLHAYQQEHSHPNAAAVLIALLQLAYADLAWQYTHLHDEAEQSKSVDQMALSAAVDHQNLLLGAVESLLKDSTSVAVKDYCFRLLTDLFILATGKLNNTVLQPLAITTQRLRELQTIYNTTVVSLIETTNVDQRIDENTEEVTEEQRAAIIADCRILALVNAAKVVAYDHTSLPANAAKSVTLRHGELSAIVIGCLTQYGDECDQIIKALMGELKAIGTNVLMYAQFIALRQLHHRQSIDMEELKAIAQRLALLFAFAPNISFIGFMKVAIGYALNDAPTNLNFLDVILPFLQRTRLRDIQPVQRYLDDAKRIEMEKSALDESALDELEWAPLKHFSDALAKKAVKANAKDIDADQVSVAEKSTRSPAAATLSPIPVVSTPSQATDRRSTSLKARRQLPTTPEVAEEEDEDQSTTARTSTMRSVLATPLSPIRETRKRGRPRKTQTPDDDNGGDMEEDVAEVDESANGNEEDEEAAAAEDEPEEAEDAEEEIVEPQPKRGRRARQ